MAPEMVSEAGYREEIDWWSLGVLMYELMFQRRPFRGDTRKDLMESIVLKKIKIATKKFSVECIDFCRKVSIRICLEALYESRASGLKVSYSVFLWCFIQYFSC
jgi:serine/threonine protein kinase